jgi:hypothetical protein
MRTSTSFARQALTRLNKLHAQALPNGLAGEVREVKALLELTIETAEQEENEERVNNDSV